MTGTELEPVVDGELAPRVELEPAEHHRAAMQLLREAIAQLDIAVEANPEDVDGLTRALVLSERLRRDFAVLIDNITNHLWDAMPDKTAVVDGVGLVEKKAATANSRWDHDELWGFIRRAVMERAVDLESGEVRLSAPDAINEVIGEARAMLSPGAWRKTALRDRGIDPSEVSEEHWGKRTVRVTMNGGNL